MNTLKIIARYISLFFIHVIVVLQCYALSLVTTGSILSFVQFILSVFNKSMFVFDVYPFWQIYLFASIPLGIIFFVLVEFELIGRLSHWRIRRAMKKTEEK